MNTLLFLTAAVTFSLSAQSKETNYIFVSPYYDYINAEKTPEMNNESTVYGLGIDVGYRFNKNYALRSRFEQLEIGNGTNNDSENYMLGLDGQYFFDTFNNDAYIYIGPRLSKANKSLSGIDLGLGYEHLIDKRWSLRAEVGTLYFSQNDDILPHANIGVTYRFEQPEKRYVQKQIETYKDVDITLNLNVKFEHDSSVIKSLYEKNLIEVANFLNKYKDKTVTIEGHASYLGTNEYNLRLSQRRADAVKSYLVNKYNVNALRVNTIGYGEERPLNKEKTLEANRINRRVVAVLHATEKVLY